MRDALPRKNDSASRGTLARLHKWDAEGDGVTVNCRLYSFVNIIWIDWISTNNLLYYYLAFVSISSYMCLYIYI